MEGSQTIECPPEYIKTLPGILKCVEMVTTQNSIISVSIAELCNCISKFGYCHNVYRQLWRECIVTKRLRPGSRGFHWQLAKCLSFDDEIPGSSWLGYPWGYILETGDIGLERDTCVYQTSSKMILAYRCALVVVLTVEVEGHLRSSTCTCVPIENPCVHELLLVIHCDLSSVSHPFRDSIIVSYSCIISARNAFLFLDIACALK